MKSFTLPPTRSLLFVITTTGLFFSLVYPGALRAEDWGTYRHDRARSGVTSDKVAVPLTLRWVHEPAHAPEPAWHKPAEEVPRMRFDSAHHVAAAHGKVYFGSSVDNRVYALDQKDGTIRWTFVTSGPVRCAPSVSQGHVYVGSDDGHVYCLGAEAGNLIWSYRPGPSTAKILGNGRMISVWPIRTGVLVDEDLVYFAAGVFPNEGLYVCALKAADGSLVWKNDTVGDRSFEMSYGGISPQGYLLASKTSLYVPSGRAMPAVFDRQDGRYLRFLAPGGKVGGTWALLDGDRIITGVDSSGTPAKIAYRDSTGEREGDAFAWFPGRDLVVTPEFSYVLNNTGVTAINRARYTELGAQRKQITQTQQQLTQAQAALRRAQSGSDAAARQELDRQSQENVEKTRALDREIDRFKDSVVQWRFSRDGLSGLILAGETLFACADASVIGVDARTGREVWSDSITGKPVGLAASEADLLVSTEQGAVCCFGAGVSSAVSRVRQSVEPRPETVDSLTPIYDSVAGQIVQETAVRKGYALVLGGEQGRLALALARKTELKIVALEPDAAKRETARQLLSRAGLYGSRVVVEAWNLVDLPDYFANLIVSDALLISGQVDYAPDEVLRVLRPHGGTVFLGQPSDLPSSVKQLLREQLLAWVASTGGTQPAVSDKGGFWVKLTRGGLKGEGSWTQLYGSPANRGSSEDQLVQGPFGVLWYGEPGGEHMVERHARAPAPLCLDGRLFIEGGEMVQAVDAYNGTPLWQRKIPGAVRVRVDVDGGNLAASPAGLFVAAFDKCHRLDPASGDTLQTFELPPTPATGASASAASTGSVARRWSYVAVVSNTLFGSSSAALRSEYASIWKKLVADGEWRIPQPLPEEFASFADGYLKSFLNKHPKPNEEALADLHRAGLLWRLMEPFPGWGSERSPAASRHEKIMDSNSLFALDLPSGAPRWTYRGRSMANISFTVGADTIFFLDDAATEEHRKAALAEKQRLIGEEKYEESTEARIKPEEADVRMVVALDTTTGKKLWERPVDLTGCGGFRAGLAYQDGVLLCFGHFSNHDRELFNTGSLTWRRVTALDARSGETLWSKPLNYLRRPLIVGDSILVEPRLCSLRTGQIKMRTHPITGEQTPWEFHRPGHCCSVTSASARSIFFRSFNDAFCDLNTDRGVSYFGGIRTGCWINYIAANGLLLIPESSSGCTCSFPLRTTVVLKNRKPKEPRDWTIFIAQNPVLPVQQLAVNFGAPGDMQDDDGTLWFGYPRPKVSYGIKFNLKEQVLPGMGFFATDFRGLEIRGTDKPWLYASGGRGLQKCELELLGEAMEGESDRYTLRLGFVAPEGDQPGQRVFDIKVQERVVAEDFDVCLVAGGTRQAWIKEIRGLSVNKNLVMELVPKATNPTPAQAPILCHLQVVREKAPPGTTAQ